jgi:DNA-directed RNA polymerase sigma subunit (sigma70/sigma32)
MSPYTLKDLARAGYILGLPTIGEVANHMRSHYDAYFLIENLINQLNEFEELVEKHDETSIFNFLTDDDKREMDDDLEKAMAKQPAPESFDAIVDHKP